ncbi:MAG: double zinc ribbon domain-containing protein [Coprococcus sp.]
MNWKEWTALLYPPECPVCQKLLSDTEDRRRHIHGDCYRKLRRIVEPMCKRCGKPLLSAQQNTAMTVRDGHRPVKQDTVCGCMMLSVQKVYLLISMTERELMRIFTVRQSCIFTGTGLNHCMCSN